MDVDLRDLELLDALGRHQTLTAAARHLYVSQPALSQRLTRLEERLGIPLFERRGRRIEVNRAGERMLQAARMVLSELAEAERDVRELRDGRRAPVRLTSQCATNYEWLAGILHDFRSRMPGVEVSIENMPADEPIPALLDGRLDIALVCKLDGQMNRVRLHRLFDDELIALVAASHPWARQPRVEARDFDDVHLVLHQSYDPASTPAVPLPIPPGATPGRLTTIPLANDLLVEMVASGDAVTILPTWVAAPYLSGRDVVAVPVGSTPQSRTWYCATRHGAREEQVDAFVDVLLGHFAGERRQPRAAVPERVRR
jgi:LysR family transcriptional regulator, regulator for metE and metH